MLRFRQSQISFHLLKKKKELRDENISVLQFNTTVPSTQRGKTGKTTRSRGHQSILAKKLKLCIKFIIN